MRSWRRGGRSWRGLLGLRLPGRGISMSGWTELRRCGRIAADEHADIGGPGFRLVEHTSINPNKAAHIGHLRNAILGDTFQRLLRRDGYKTGYDVGVQNYIDNTGVQVADVVVGLVHLEGKTIESHAGAVHRADGEQTVSTTTAGTCMRGCRQWYTGTIDDAMRCGDWRGGSSFGWIRCMRWSGGNETAEIADLVATSVLRRHLETMERLGIEYDFLPRESEILRCTSGMRLGL